LEEGIHELERKYTYILSKSTDNLNNSLDNSKDMIDRSFERKESLNNSGEKRSGSFYKPDSDPSSPNLHSPPQIPQQQVEEQKKSDSMEALGTPERIKTEDIFFSDGTRRDRVKGKMKELVKRALKKSTVDDVPEEESNIDDEPVPISKNDRRSLRVSIDNEADLVLDDNKDKKKKKEKERKREDTEDFAPRRRARGVSTASAKEIPNFSGEIHMKFASDKKWIKYFARINSGCLVLYKSMLVKFSEPTCSPIS